MEPAAPMEQVLVSSRVKTIPDQPLSSTTSTTSAHMSDIPERHKLAGSACLGPAFENGTTLTHGDFYRLLDRLISENAQFAASRREAFVTKEKEAIKSQPVLTDGSWHRVDAFLKEDAQIRHIQSQYIASCIAEFLKQNIPDSEERRRFLASVLERHRFQTAKEEEETFKKALLEIHDTTPLQGLMFASWGHRVAWNATRWFGETEKRNRFFAWDIEQIKKESK